MIICDNCKGDGFIVVPEHASDCKGECHNCPVPVQIICDKCEGKCEIDWEVFMADTQGKSADDVYNKATIYVDYIESDLEAARATIQEIEASDIASSRRAMLEARIERDLAIANLKTAKKDTERLDWIDRNMDCTLAGSGLHVSLVEQGDDQTLREAIDEAMKENDK